MEYTEQDKINSVNELRELLSIGEGKCISEESLSLICAYINDLEVHICMLENKYSDVSEYSIVKGK